MSDDLVTAARKAIKAIDDMRLGISVHNGRMPTSNYPITGPVVNALTEAWIDLNAALEALPPSIEERKTGRASISHDGFEGDIIGSYYVTREGKRGVVVQQDGTRVVHVYGEKWIGGAEPLPEAPTETSVDGFVAAVVALAEAGIESDLQELLVRGNPVRGIKPNALLNAIEAYNGAASLPEAPIPEQRGSEEDAETLLIYLRGSLSRTGRDGFVDVPRSYIDQAIALLSSPPIPDHVEADVMGGDWQLIETVPKDGRLILLWDEDCGHPVVAGWSNNHQCFVEQYGGRDPAPDTDITGCKVYLPTHWMPLAAAPKPSGDESGKESGE